MALEPTATGTLQKTPLAHLVVYCLDRKLRGTLVLRPEGDADTAHADLVTLVDGRPAKIRVADAVDHLGRILVELGAIDDATYNESLMTLGRGEGLHGQILLRQGKLDAAALEKGLRTQLSRKLGHLFSRPATTWYGYYDGVDLLQRYGGPELFPMDPAPVVFTAARANPSLPHLDAVLAKVANSALRLRPHAELGRFEVTRAERELLGLLSASPMSIAQMQQAGVADERTARTLVYGLLLLKLVEPVAGGAVSLLPGTVRPAAPVGAPVAIHSPPMQALGRNPSPIVRVALKRIPSGRQTVDVVEEHARRSESSPPSSDSRRERSERPPDSLPVGARPSSETDARRAEIVARAAAVGKEDYFQILGISGDSTPEDAKNAYFQLAKRWHPDRLPGELLDLKDHVGKVFTLMAEAYQTLTDAERRPRYLKQREEGGGTPEAQAEVGRVVEAANAFAKGEFFVNKGLLGEAEPHVGRAFELDPKVPDHVALWCWVEANKAERREAAKYDDLLAKLDEALAGEPKSDRARFYRGMILKIAGRMGDAIRDFKDIAESNPRNVDAVREVRLYTMRQERDRGSKDQGSGSLLGKFLKKK